VDKEIFKESFRNYEFFLCIWLLLLSRHSTTAPMLYAKAYCVAGLRSFCSAANFGLYVEALVKTRK